MLKVIQVREEENVELMLRYASKAGYENVAVSFGRAEAFIGDDYKQRIEEIQGYLNDYNLKCVQTHLPFYHLLVSAEEMEEEMEIAIKRCIEESAALGAKWTAFHPRSTVNDGFNRTKSFESNKKMLDNYLECAEKNGVGIAVENMPLYPHARPDWRFFGGGYEEICELCESFKSDKLGICWDFGHAHTAALDQVNALRDIGDRLKLTHVHDNYRFGDHHLLPLQGSIEWNCIDWKNVMPALKDINYEGPLTLELIYPPDSMLESFMKQSYACLGELIELSENKKTDVEG